MSDQTPNSDAVPPRPAEAAKVQPKKETVRIPLPAPPKQAASTIKLPTSPVGGPPPPVAAASAAPVTLGRAPVAPTPPAGGAPSSSLAKTGSQAATASAAAPAPVKPAPRPSPVGRGVSGVDVALAAVAAVVAIAAVVSIFLLNQLAQTGIQ